MHPFYSPLTQLHKITKLPTKEAVCLPFSAYRSKDVYTAEKKNIFHSDWVFVCAKKELPNIGDYLSFMLADEPVVVLRSDDNKIRAMSNVCRHRGTLLNTLGKGNTKRMVCPYHAWTYNDKGELLGVPFAKNNDIDKSSHCLPIFKVEIWNHLIFINLSADAPSLKKKVSGINKYFKLFEMDRFTEVYSNAPEQWQANWKLALENAMESYHLFKVHHETLEQVTPTKAAFYLESAANWTVTAGKMKGTSNKVLDWIMGNNKKIYEHYILISLPPSFVGILTYESFDWIKILPSSSTSCYIESGGMSTTMPSPDSKEQQFTAAFLLEDKEICERVQLGMSAEHSTGGQLVDLERVVVDFHHYLAERLFNEQTEEHYQSPEVELFFN